MGNANCHGNGHFSFRVETTLIRGKSRIQDMEKDVYPRGTKLDWTLYSARQGICSMPAKHVWKNRQHRRMVLVPKDQYIKASTVKMKDQEPVIKMVTSVDQATEMAMTELKREQDALRRKAKNRSLHWTDSFLTS